MVNCAPVHARSITLAPCYGDPLATPTTSIGCNHDLEGRDDYEKLINDNEVRVVEQQTIPTGDGAVLRVVDYRETDGPAPRTIYSPPVC
jgi:hypothetical protein